MKYGIREICDVVLKDKDTGVPVIYFDSLKTSTMEGAATTVYAQGGRGNSRLIAWEGERTVTFTMEDALISELGLQVLTGAGLIDASTENVIAVHVTERCKVEDGKASSTATLSTHAEAKAYAIELDKNDEMIGVPNEVTSLANYEVKDKTGEVKAVMFDYYTDKTTKAKQITINAKDFAGNYYLEASTLFRDEAGNDHAAEFVIPNCKIQSNFTFTMAATGDPSTFTFTMDAFPDYTKFDPTEKVFCAIQIVD